MSSGYEKEKERNRFAVTGKGKPEGALYIQGTAKSARSEETRVEGRKCFICGEKLGRQRVPRVLKKNEEASLLTTPDNRILPLKTTTLLARF